MILKPQDVVVLLKLVAIGRQPWTYASLANALQLSASQMHSAVKRLLKARLAVQRGREVAPQIRNAEEFLVHGVRYAFVPEHGAVTRGMPTGYAAPPLDKMFRISDELPSVWPDPEGDVRGISFSPLYKNVPDAARRDSALYELLALVDAIRDGRARERMTAAVELRLRLDRFA